MKIQEIRLDRLFWGIIIGIPTVVVIAEFFSGRFVSFIELSQLSLSMLSFSCTVILPIAFIYLLWKSNFLDEWLQFKLKEQRWKRFFFTALCIFSLIILILLLNLEVNVWTENAEQTFALIRQHRILFVFSVEVIIIILALYIGSILNAPRKLKSKLKEIPQELIINHPSDAIRQAFVIFESTLREKIAEPPGTYGEPLINKAFSEKAGEKLIYSDVSNERKGVRNLMSGFYAVYRNPIMHRNLSQDRAIAELILLQLDQFMEIINNSKVREQTENLQQPSSKEEPLEDSDAES